MCADWGYLYLKVHFSIRNSRNLFFYYLWGDVLRKIWINFKLLEVSNCKVLMIIEFEETDQHVIGIASMLVQYID